MDEMYGMDRLQRVQPHLRTCEGQHQRHARRWRGAGVEVCRERNDRSFILESPGRRVVALAEKEQRGRQQRRHGVRSRECPDSGIADGAEMIGRCGVQLNRELRSAGSLELICM